MEPIVLTEEQTIYIVDKKNEIKDVRCSNKLYRCDKNGMNCDECFIDYLIECGQFKLKQ